MTRSLYENIAMAYRQAHQFNDRWMICEAGIVVDIDDPDKEHRIKVIIPSIDEHEMYDEWVRPLVPFAMGDGYGFVFLPKKGDEVFLTGVLGQRFNLCYHGAAYNEETHRPNELGPDTPGIKVPNNLALIAGLLMKVQAQELEIIAQTLVKVSGEQVRIEGGAVTVNSDGSITIEGANVAVVASGNLTLQGRTVNKVGPPI